MWTTFSSTWGATQFARATQTESWKCGTWDKWREEASMIAVLTRQTQWCLINLRRFWQWLRTTGRLDCSTIRTRSQNTPWRVTKTRCRIWRLTTTRRWLWVAARMRHLESGNDEYENQNYLYVNKISLLWSHWVLDESGLAENESHRLVGEQIARPFRKLGQLSPFLFPVNCPEQVDYQRQQCKVSNCQGVPNEVLVFLKMHVNWL